MLRFILLMGLVSIASMGLCALGTVGTVLGTLFAPLGTFAVIATTD